MKINVKHIDEYAKRWLGVYRRKLISHFSPTETNQKEIVSVFRYAISSADEYLKDIVSTEFSPVFYKMGLVEDPYESRVETLAKGHFEMLLKEVKKRNLSKAVEIHNRLVLEGK